jgi:hypothetical protein
MGVSDIVPIKKHAETQRRGETPANQNQSGTFNPAYRASFPWRSEGQKSFGAEVDGGGDMQDILCRKGARFAPPASSAW